MSSNVELFPQPVVLYLKKLLIDERLPVLLTTDRKGFLMQTAGDLTVYGLDKIETGRLLSDQADFLEGLLPIEAGDTMLPCIQVAANRYADVHLIRGENTDFILLIDATSVEGQKKLLHQKANDLNLMRNHHTNFLDLLCGLDIVLLLFVNEVTFRPLGKAPEWLEHCGLRAVDDVYQTASPLEFLSTFVSATEEFWSNHEGRHISGPWVETDPNGKEWYFEATAIRKGKDKYYLLQRLAPYTDSRFALLQKAREQNLEYLQLARKEKALREKELRNRILLQAVPDWIFRVNRDGKILDLKASMGKNPAIFREFLGQSLRDVFPEDAAEKMIENARNALISKTLQLCTFSLGSMHSSFPFEARAVAIGEDEVVILVRDLPEEEQERGKRN